MEIDEHLEGDNDEGKQAGQTSEEIHHLWDCWTGLWRCQSGSLASGQTSVHTTHTQHTHTLTLLKRKAKMKQPEVSRQPQKKTKKN